MIRYFWIAEYKDGTVLPQFNFETGIENLFKEIDQSKLIRFGLYPFTPEILRNVNCGELGAPSKIVINIYGNDKLFFRRRNSITISGKQESRKIEYLLGTQNYILHIDELGNVEVKKE